jgi:hypothetical protein
MQGKRIITAVGALTLAAGLSAGLAVPASASVSPFSTISASGGGTQTVAPGNSGSFGYGFESTPNVDIGAIIVTAKPAGWTVRFSHLGLTVFGKTFSSYLATFSVPASAVPGSYNISVEGAEVSWPISTATVTETVVVPNPVIPLTVVQDPDYSQVLLVPGAFGEEYTWSTGYVVSNTNDVPENYTVTATSSIGSGTVTGTVAADSTAAGTIYFGPAYPATFAGEAEADANVPSNVALTVEIAP